MSKQGLFWRGIALLALAIHGGTALLRLDTFWPYPKLVDFGAFYAAAAAMRQGLSPYFPDAAFVDALRAASGMPFHPPPVFNPPPWPFLLQPLTLLPFPGAAWAWLLLQLAILAWCGRRLAELAGIDGIGRWAVLAVTVTFGPVFLDLSLGQTSTVLLLAALVIGRSLSTPGRQTLFRGAAGQALAVAAKLYPAFWTGALVLRRRWRTLALSLLLTGAVFLAVSLAQPETSLRYWRAYLPARVTAATEQVNVDDQAWMAWWARLTLPQSFAVPGLNPDERHSVRWDPVWDLAPTAVRTAGYLILAAVAGATMWALWRTRPEADEPAFYLWVLLGLLAFPHMERYNHALLLPAMAWLWGQGERGRRIAVTGYLLAGAARLTHLWVLVLPWPWAPLATGSGVLAVLLLMAGMVQALRRPAPGGGT